MKKIFAFAVAVIASVSMYAQSEVGAVNFIPKVGMTLSSATSDAGKNTKAAVGLTAGVDVAYQAAEKFAVSVGVNYQGNNVKNKLNNLIYSNYYLNIPVMANCYVMPGLAVKAGVAANILMSAKVDGNSEFLGNKVKDDYKSTYFALPVGVSYEISDFVIDARYNFGLSKAGKGGSGTYNALTLTVGYKI